MVASPHFGFEEHSHIAWELSTGRDRFSLNLAVKLGRESSATLAGQNLEPPLGCERLERAGRFILVIASQLWNVP
jgi:hypothetical protein